MASYTGPLRHCLQHTAKCKSRVLEFIEILAANTAVLHLFKSAKDLLMVFFLSYFKLYKPSPQPKLSEEQSCTRHGDVEILTTESAIDTPAGEVETLTTEIATYHRHLALDVASGKSVASTAISSRWALSSGPS